MRTLLHSLGLGFIAFIFCVPVLALAQASADPLVPPAPDISSLLNDLMGTVSTWKAGGWIAGCVALVNLLVNMLKFPFIDNWLTKLNIGWWLRPVLSVLLGIAAAVFANLLGGVGAGTAILIALLAGLSSTGFHELMTALFNDRTRAERAAGAKLMDALKSADGNAATAIEPMLTKLAVISLTPGADVRVKELAAWANANQPVPAPVPEPTPAPAPVEPPKV